MASCRREPFHLSREDSSQFTHVGPGSRRCSSEIILTDNSDSHALTCKSSTLRFWILRATIQLLKILLTYKNRGSPVHGVGTLHPNDAASAAASRRGIDSVPVPKFSTKHNFLFHPD